MTVVFQTAQGALPSSYVVVHRWANSGEVELWKSTPSHIPLGLASGERVYVTLPGAPKPSGTGRFRIEFAVPTAMLRPGSDPQQRQIFGPVANTPILNLRIVQT